MDHGRIYNEQLHVPLIFKLPTFESEAGTRHSDLASLSDVLPTLTAALELPLAESEIAQFEGHDLFSAAPPRRYVFSERVSNEREWEPGPKFSLTTLEWKYFHLPSGDDSLFSMTEDRHETVNLIAERPEVASRMKAKILDILAESASRTATMGEPRLSPEVVEELRALGYVD
jgi:arylsulfatase A-like enzyme